jgi:ABC-2 type transport system permease protein
MPAREHPTWLVAKREILEATRTTSFRLTLLISAIALAAIIVIANLGSDDPTTQDVVVVGGSGETVAGIEALAAIPGMLVEVTSAPDDAAAAVMLEDGDADVVVAADGSRLTTLEPVDLDADSDRARLLNVLLANLALDNGLREAGLTPEEAARVRDAPPPAVESIRGEDPDEIDSSRLATATITNILLFIMLQSYGQWVLTGVTREKASRVVEVLLSVITPRQLLVGKVVGIGLVALLHAAVLIVTAFATTRIVGVDLTEGLALGDLALSGVWFVLGYALYCGVYAAAGSLVSRVEDAQSAAFPIMLPLLFGYFASFSVAEGANTLLWVLAFIPPTAVVAMPTLYAIGEAPVWMVGVSMGLTVLAILLVGALAAKIYERSILHSGKRLGWKEALRRSSEIAPAKPRSAVTAD